MLYLPDKLSWEKDGKHSVDSGEMVDCRSLLLTTETKQSV